MSSPRRAEWTFGLGGVVEQVLHDRRQVADHDNREAIAHEWARPVDLLERHRRAECKLRTPTLHTLRRPFR